MTEEIRDRFAIVSTTNSLGQNHGYVDALNLGALSHILLLGYCIRDDNCFKLRVVQTLKSRSTEDTVNADGIHLLRSGFNQSEIGLTSFDE